MADFLIDGGILTDIADAIRGKTEESGVIIPEDMATAISGISGGSDRFYIIDPNILDNVYANARVEDGSFTSSAICQARQKHGRDWTFLTFQFGNTDKVCLAQTDKINSNSGMYLPIKIQPGQYSKAYIELAVPESGGQYSGLWFELFPTAGFKSGNVPGDPSEYLVQVSIASGYTTSEAINSQPGVKINNVNNTTLDAQTVEIDLSGVDEPFYVGFHQFGNITYIRSIYLE